MESVLIALLERAEDNVNGGDKGVIEFVNFK